MGFMKDLWIEEIERRTSELEEQGYSFHDAIDKACDEDMTDRVRDRLADMADHARDQWKERNI